PRGAPSFLRAFRNSRQPSVRDGYGRFLAVAAPDGEARAATSVLCGSSIRYRIGERGTKPRARQKPAVLQMVTCLLPKRAISQPVIETAKLLYLLGSRGR